MALTRLRARLRASYTRGRRIVPAVAAGLLMAGGLLAAATSPASAAITPADTNPATALTITTTSLPAAQVDQPYSATLTGTGGAPPYDWSIAPSLPTGLSLDPVTGVISGVPTAATRVPTSYTVTLTDSNSQAATASFPLVVNPPPLAITTTSLPDGTASSAYSQTLTAAGGIAPYTWSLAPGEGTLPAGLSLNTATGVISGTPTSGGTANFTVGAADAENPAMTAIQPLSISISPAALAVTTTSLPAAQVGQAYSATLTGAGGTLPYDWSIAPPLPAGLSLNGSTGVISGTPTTVSTSPTSYVVTLTDANSQTATQSFEFIVNPAPLAVTTTSLPGGTVGSAYNQTLTAAGGIAPYTWSLAPGEGTLPAGLALNTATGVISGTPTSPGTANFTVRAADAENPAMTAIQPLSITVSPAALAVTTTSLPGGTAGSAYSQTLGATGGIAPYTWSVSNGALPAGLTLDASTGVISGTPTGPGTAGFTVQATDSENPAMTAAEPLSIDISPAPLAVTTTSLQGATVGGSYHQTLAASGGIAPYAWSVSSGSLPTGLSLSPSTGVISGTPAVLGTSTFTVTATDAQTPAMSASQQLSITVGGCTTTITGKHTGALTVGSGVTCITGATITGAVSIPAGATVAISGSTLSGALSSSRAAALSICSTSIAGSVSVSGSTGFLLIGDNGNDGSPGCGADTIGGALALSGNTGGVQVGGATVQGPASLTGNTGGAQVEANHIGGALACSGNTPPPSDNGQPNKVSGPASGQCSGLT